MQKEPLAPIANQFLHKDIVSINQFDRSSFETVFTTVQKIKEEMQENRFSERLSKLLATLIFFEPSSRTFSSFATAVKRQGGQTLEFQNPAQTSSAVKGETLEDMARVMENYLDVIIMRHPEVGSVERVARSVQIPVVNAGDGAGEHPTQALMDMYTIYEKRGALDGITGLFAGDLLYGRTVHSLLKGFVNFKNVTLYMLSPTELRIDAALKSELEAKGLKMVEIESEEEIPVECAFWYWTRVQKERFSSEDAYNAVKNRFILTPDLVAAKGNPDLLLMHPLPRVGEITEAVDADPRAIYLTTQIQNGMYTRMALLSLILGRI